MARAQVEREIKNAQRAADASVELHRAQVGGRGCSARGRAECNLRVPALACLRCWAQLEAEMTALDAEDGGEERAREAAAR